MATVLVVDIVQLLDTSKVGVEAGLALEKQWSSAQKLDDTKKAELLTALQLQRDRLRDALLARARPIIANFARDKGAEVVLDKSAVLWASGEDITAGVIAKVDAGGPLLT